MRRKCNKCQAFYELADMRKARGCYRGLSNECRHCYNDRKRLTRHSRASRLVDA